MGSKTTDKQIVEAIKGTGGIVSIVARRLGCDWHTADKYCKRNETTIQAIEDEKESLLDLAESTIGKSIQDGDVQTSKWLLMTIGKKRGYSEKQEMEISGQGQLVIIRGNKPTS
jgi:hypothetical protein